MASPCTSGYASVSKLNLKTTDGSGFTVATYNPPDKSSRYTAGSATDKTCFDAGNVAIGAPGSSTIAVEFFCNNYFANCPFVYTINFVCQGTTPVDPCAGVNCGTHGSCSSGQCTCIDNYTGTTCSVPPDPQAPCAGVNCGTHGSCSNGQCTCIDNNTGTTCSVPPQAPGTCLLGQTCNSGMCYTAGGLTTTTSCSCICSNGSMQPISGATDCSDCTTRCAATSCTSGTSCSSSSSSSSPTATGATCGTAAVVASSTGTSPGSGAAGAYDPTAWLGTWSSEGCDTSQCCCVSTVTITNTGAGSYTSTGTELRGTGCGSATSIMQSFPVPTTSTYVYTYAGQRHTATQGNGRITDWNDDAIACSATLTKQSATSSAHLRAGSGAAIWIAGTVIALTVSLLSR